MFSKPYWTPLESINSGQGIYNCHFMSGRFLYSNDLKAISNPKFALWSFVNILPWSFLIFHFYTYGSGDTELRNIHVTIEPFLSLAYQWVMTLQNTWLQLPSWYVLYCDWAPRCLNLILKLNYLQFLSRRRI